MLNSVTLYNLSQNTISNVSIQTGLKAIGRPGFIVLDKDIDAKTKKYSATKELMYQISCLALYLALVPVFNRGAFKLAKKFFKNEDVFKLFDKPKDFKEFYKLDPQAKVKKLDALIKERNLDKKAADFTKNDESLVNGVIEVSSIASSVVGLAIIAPLISHPLIHPILKACGLEEKQK